MAPAPRRGPSDSCQAPFAINLEGDFFVAGLQPGRDKRSEPDRRLSGGTLSFAVVIISTSSPAETATYLFTLTAPS